MKILSYCVESLVFFSLFYIIATRVIKLVALAFILLVILKGIWFFESMKVGVSYEKRFYAFFGIYSFSHKTFAHRCDTSFSIKRALTTIEI